MTHQLGSALRRPLSIVFAIAISAWPAVTSAQPDPIAIIEGANSLIKLYDTLSGHKAGAVTVDLSEVNGRLAELSAQMQQVLDQLKQLGVKIDDSNDELARQRVSAVIQVITAGYGTWSKNLPKYHDDVTKARDELQLASSLLMQRRSFANYEMVAFAMTYENVLLDLLNAEPSLKRDRFKQFSQYFAATADPSIIGSLAERRDYYIGIANRIRAKHARVDAWNPIVEFLGETRAERGNRVFCIYSIFRRIDGNVETGYTATDVTERRNERDCALDKPAKEEAHDHHLTLSFAALLFSERVMWPTPQCFPVEESTNWACFRELQAGHDAFIDARTKATALTKAVDAAIALGTRAKNVVDTNKN